jgi:UDP-glucuronate 4-epimerase
MKVLITGISGFIGFHLAKRLLEEGHTVTGLDNLNTYYDVGLKVDRLNQLGFHFDNADAITADTPYTSDAITFYRTDLCDAPALQHIFDAHQFDKVVNLAAQAGVRHSIDNPGVYIQSNINGFFNLLECIRIHKTGHFIYASSSSVYGNNAVPFSTGDKTDSPVSLYAATKKANEALANSYAALFGIPATGLRFFTVYGPWGRPDMAYFSFTRKILAGEPIRIFNEGNLLRDFTYIDDIVNGLMAIVNDQQLRPDSSGYYHRIYNIGNHQPVKLLDFVRILGEQLQRTVHTELLPMQQGDVYATFADIDPLQRDYGFTPTYTIEKGLALFTRWYIDHYK